MLTLSRWITLNAILMMALGIAFALYGPLMLAFFRIADIPSQEVMLYWHIAAFARLFGAGLFSLGLLLFALRTPIAHGELSGSSQRGVIFSLLLGNLLAAIVALTQQASIWNVWAGLVLSLVFALLTFGYGYFLARRPEDG
jgi:hypothetical protein